MEKERWIDGNVLFQPSSLSLSMEKSLRRLVVMLIGRNEALEAENEELSKRPLQSQLDVARADADHLRDLLAQKCDDIATLKAENDRRKRR